MGVLGVQLVLQPKFEEAFTDFGVALSKMSLIAIQNARWLRGENPGASFPMWPATILGIGLLIGVLGATGASLRGPRIALWLLFALGVFVLLMLSTAYGLPLIAMQQSLEASGPAGTP
jgi:hypothetical protein